MKKLLFLLIMFMVTINISAQESNESAAQKIESLQLKLDKLQHEYDYFYCETVLKQIANELSIQSNNINNKSNGMLINIYHSAYDPDLYRLYKETYDADIENLNSHESYINVTKIRISQIIEKSNFTEREIEILEHSYSLVISSFNAVKKASNYYKVVLDMYKNNR